MPYIPDQQINTGSFIPTTELLDVSQIYSVDVNSPEFKELLVRLYQALNKISLITTNKDSGYYVEEEFVNSQQYFNPTDPSPLKTRGVFRRTYNIGALGAGATSTAHNLVITTAWKFTRIYGTASDTVNLLYYPIPWASAAGATNIEIYVDNTNIVITNNSGVAFTDCYVVLEYVKE